MATSCQKRGFCPSCGAKRAAAFAAFLVDEVIEQVGHTMWTFSLPKMIRSYFHYHPELRGKLCRAAYETVQEMMAAAAVGSEGFRTGVVAVTATSGDLLNLNSHVHAIAPRGGWDEDGADEVVYERKGPNGRADSEERFDPLDFLARVIAHIPEPRSHLVRYVGHYSNVSRGRRKKGKEEPLTPAHPREREDDGLSDAERRARRRAWAHLIRRVFEVDPLVCANCGGSMRIISVILEHEVITKILGHLARKGIKPGRGPPRQPSNPYPETF